MKEQEEGGLDLGVRLGKVFLVSSINWQFEIQKFQNQLVNWNSSSGKTL
jgi:hypothetical protein